MYSLIWYKKAKYTITLISPKLQKKSQNSLRMLRNVFRKDLAYIMNTEILLIIETKHILCNYHLSKFHLLVLGTQRT